MSLERNLSAVPPVLFTADGTQYGVVVVTSTANFYVKSIACIKAASVNGGNPTKVEIKRIVSPTVMWVGPPGVITLRTDLTAYTVAAGSILFAEEQPKAKIDMETRLLASYIQEPINAWRVQTVDYTGNPIGPNNPLPVSFDGTISIGAVEVHGQNGNTIEPNTDGSINVVVQSTPSSNVTLINKYNELAALASGSTTVLVTYTVPPSKESVLQKCAFSGDNIGKYQVLINNVVQDTGRTMFGADLTGCFDFTTGNENGIVLVAGDIVKIQVFNPRPYAADYNARIQVLEINL